jgi:hypothetical protein
VNGRRRVAGGAIWGGLMWFRLESVFAADGKVPTPHSILKLGNDLTTKSKFLQQFEFPGSLALWMCRAGDLLLL